MATTSQETFFRCVDYQDAKTQSKGYEDTNLIKGLVLNNKKNPPWKQKHNDYIKHRQLELLSAVMRILCENKYTTIKIADIGGGNGYLSVVIKKQLPMVNFDWIVFESNQIVLSYVQFEEESKLKWRSSSLNFIDSYEIGLFSCTLQYLEEPFEILRKFSSKCRYLIIMRIPFIDEVHNVITKQVFLDGIYKDSKSSWPAWFFSKDKFYSEIKQIGQVIYKWKTPSEVLLFEGKNIVMEGVLIRVY